MLAINRKTAVSHTLLPLKTGIFLPKRPVTIGNDLYTGDRLKYSRTGSHRLFQAVIKKFRRLQGPRQELSLSRCRAAYLSIKGNSLDSCLPWLDLKAGSFRRRRHRR